MNVKSETEDAATCVSTLMGVITAHAQEILNYRLTEGRADVFIFRRQGPLR